MHHADPFLEPTGNVSDAFANEITPSGWTFIIWTIIYIFLALVCVYALSGLFRKCVTISDDPTVSYWARLRQTSTPVAVISAGTPTVRSTAAQPFCRMGSSWPGA